MKCWLSLCNTIKDACGEPRAVIQSFTQGVGASAWGMNHDITSNELPANGVGERRVCVCVGGGDKLGEVLRVQR